jgi:hypothetical protein
MANNPDPHFRMALEFLYIILMFYLSYEMFYSRDGRAKEAKAFLS